jgi:hypothetical protein
MICPAEELQIWYWNVSEVITKGFNAGIFGSSLFPAESGIYQGRGVFRPNLRYFQPQRLWF